MPKTKIKRSPQPRRKWLSRLEINMQSMTFGGMIGWMAAVVIGLGVIMNASGYVLTFIIGWWTSGPMPYPSRAELEALKTYTTLRDGEITAQLSKLDDRQAQSTERGALVAENLKSLQISNVKAELAAAEADALRNPNSDAARKLVQTYREELENLETMIMKLSQ